MNAATNSTAPATARAERQILTPTNLHDALVMRAEHPEATVINGGTDLMVDINYRRRAPELLLDLSRVAELRRRRREGAAVRLGAGVTFATLEGPPFLTTTPALSQAARTVGSQQIRNRGTLGGNLATCSPAGDAWPPLVAGLAEVEVASVRGRRRLAVSDFALGPKKSALAADELVVRVAVPTARGPQAFLKVGPRNSMVISIASLAVITDTERGELRAAYGSAGPVVGLVRLPLADARDLPDAVADACRPIDDVRGSADYRRQALRVLAARAVERCLR
ncbi:FAD binding domain-containing protein [Streptomyces aureus]|uniref:Xanthine dehydrogenase family protein subunit M n=1 Tax=Streptomyces aureus TaxID=193461 RepID=A0ABV4SMN8_9ACTN